MTVSLTLTDARARAAVVRDIAYQVDLDLSGDEHFVATTTVTFSAEPGSSTFLDLQHASDVEVTLNDRQLDGDCYGDEQVHLDDLQEQNTAVVTATMPYVTDGDGMHRFVDPADDAVYLGCYGGMDVNRRVFACFDQPDLKGTFAVSVTARPGATVLSNGIPEQSPPEGEGGRWTFSTTPPIATYLVTVNAGPWASRTWEHDGRPFGWHARASLADDLDRDLPMLREQTEAAYAWYADRFEEPYPFDSYDQAFVPGHNWGAMETPGCVTYRDEMLPQGTTPAAVMRGRAMVIAHEMAHMWFGDLVTFRWWEDTWLNESFADYMGFLVSGETGSAPGALAEFDLGRKAGGYAADARPSTHAVAPTPEDVPDVDSAFNNFDPISYAKGNSSLRQLAFWLGEKTFFAGVNRHLTGARFGTATLDDFVASLQSASDRDVTGWVEAWLRRSGTDQVRLERDERADHGMRLRLVGERPHRLRVSGYSVVDGDGDGDGGGTTVQPRWEEVVDLCPENDTVELQDADLVVPNSTGDTFCRVVLDEQTLGTALEVLGRVPEEHPRVILWATLLEMALRGEVRPEVLVRAAEDHLPGEATAFVVETVLVRAVGIVRAVTPADELPALAERLGQSALRILGADDLDEAVAEAAVQAAAWTLHDEDLLRSWLAPHPDGTRDLPDRTRDLPDRTRDLPDRTRDLPDGTRELTQEERWEVLLRLAELGADTDDLVASERERDTSESGRLSALSIGAARPGTTAKREALSRMAAAGTSNREIMALSRGLWSSEQRELVDPLVQDYLTEMVPVARRGQALGLVVGRAAPTFRLTTEQLAAVETALEDRTLPPVLARHWADLLHDQRRLT